MKISRVILPLALLLGGALAEYKGSELTINCDGSSLCYLAPGIGAGEIIDALKSAITRMVKAGKGSTIWGEKEQLACHLSYCAFFQHTHSGNTTTKMALSSINKLIDHGCTFCGTSSINVNETLRHGAFTINYVKHPCCEGPSCLCVRDVVPGYPKAKKPSGTAVVHATGQNATAIVAPHPTGHNATGIVAADSTSKNVTSIDAAHHTLTHTMSIHTTGNHVTSTVPAHPKDKRILSTLR